MNSIKLYYDRVAKRIPLRLLLIIPFVVEILVAVGLTGYLTISNGQNAVRNLGIQLSAEISDNTKEQILNDLEKPYSISRILKVLIAEGKIDPNSSNPQDIESIEHTLWAWVKENSIDNLAVATPEGINITISAQDHQFLSNIADTPDSGIRKVYRLDDRGKRVELIATQKFDVRSRDWYKNAIKADKAVWNDFFVSATLNLVSVSISQPVYSDDKRLLAVQNTAYRIKRVHEFLKNLQVSPHGQTFIIDTKGNLVASSVLEEPFIVTGQKIEQIPAIKADNPIMRFTAQSLSQRFRDLNMIDGNEKLDFLFNGERLFVQVSPIKDEVGISWLSVVVVPESDFAAEIAANTRTTILLCLLALIVAIVLGVYTSQWITEPILRLNRAAKAIAEGELEQTVESSNIKEIQDLDYSFNRMAKQIQESFCALEQVNDQLEDKVEERTIELKNALENLKNAQLQLLQSEKITSLGKLVAGVAHEINNPISFIYGNIIHIEEYSQNLLELIELYQTELPHPSNVIIDKIADIDLDFLKSDVNSLLSSVKIGAERVREIIKSLRNFSRLDESGQKIVDIHEGIESTLLILQHQWQTKENSQGIKLLRNYGALPPVECYPGQLNQVFMNMLINAIEAIEELKLNQPEHKGQIEIRTTRVEAEGVEVAIVDNGIVMNETVKRRIFEPFFTTKPVGKGTGMGMSISYQIILEQHQGTMKCSSSPGEGTEFIVQIPIKQPKKSVANILT